MNFRLCFSLLLCFLFFFYCSSGGDDENGDQLAVSSLSPAGHIPHVPVFDLVVRGNGFSPASKIYFNNNEMVTTFVSSQELSCRITPDDTLAFRHGLSSGTSTQTEPHTDVPVFIRDSNSGDSNSINFWVLENPIFSEPVDLYSSNEWDHTARLSTSQNGNIYMIWQGSSLRFAKSSDEGETWSEPVTLGENGGSHRIVADSGNTVYVAYVINVFNLGANRGYLVHSEDGGATWSQPDMINNVKHTTDYLDLAINSSDKVFLALIHQDMNFNYDIYFAQIEEKTIDWNKSVRVARQKLPATHARLVAGNGKDFYLIWKGYRENALQGEGRLYFSKSSNNGETWSSPVNLYDRVAEDHVPEIAIAPNGNLLIAYVSYNSNAYVIMSTDNGKSWGEPIHITYGIDPSYFDTTICVDSLGNINLLFPGSGAVFCRSIDGGLHWSESVTAYNGNDASMVIKSDGTVLGAGCSLQKLQIFNGTRKEY